MLSRIPSSYELKLNRITKAGADQRSASLLQNPVLAAGLKNDLILKEETRAKRANKNWRAICHGATTKKQRDKSSEELKKLKKEMKMKC